MVLEKKHGRSWKLLGFIKKAGRTIRGVEKSVDASSEEEIESAERAIRSALYEKALKLFRGDMKDVTIEVETEIEKSVGPSGPKEKR